MSDAARARLARERAETEERLAALERGYRGIVEASEGSNADDEHDPEGSTIAYERSQVGAFIDQARAQLSEVDAALERLEQGRYGVCERCGEAIPAGRLEARPTARTCVGCVVRRV